MINFIVNCFSSSSSLQSFQSKCINIVREICAKAFFIQLNLFTFEVRWRQPKCIFHVSQINKKFVADSRYQYALLRTFIILCQKVYRLTKKRKKKSCLTSNLQSVIIVVEEHLQVANYYITWNFSKRCRGHALTHQKWWNVVEI